MFMIYTAMRVIAGFFLVLLVASTVWAGVAVDFGGGSVRALKDGRLVLLLEIRSDAPLREVRVEMDDRFPLSPAGARLDEKIRWQAVPVSAGSLRLLPAHGGSPVQVMNLPLIVQGKGGRDARDIFQAGGRERRPSFTVVAVGADGREERVKVSMPHVARIRVSDE